MSACSEKFTWFVPANWRELQELRMIVSAVYSLKVALLSPSKTAYLGPLMETNTHCNTTRRLHPVLFQAVSEWRRPNVDWPGPHRTLTPHTSIFSTQFLLSLQFRMVEMTSGGNQSTLSIPHKCMSRSPRDVTHEQTRWRVYGGHSWPCESRPGNWFAAWRQIAPMCVEPANSMREAWAHSGQVGPSYLSLTLCVLSDNAHNLAPRRAQITNARNGPLSHHGKVPGLGILLQEDRSFVGPSSRYIYVCRYHADCSSQPQAS